MVNIVFTKRNLKQNSIFCTLSKINENLGIGTSGKQGSILRTIRSFNNSLSSLKGSRLIVKPLNSKTEHSSFLKPPTGGKLRRYFLSDFVDIQRKSFFFFLEKG